MRGSREGGGGVESPEPRGNQQVRKVSIEKNGPITLEKVGPSEKFTPPPPPGILENYSFFEITRSPL